MNDIQGMFNTLCPQMISWVWMSTCLVGVLWKTE